MKYQTFLILLVLLVSITMVIGKEFELTSTNVDIKKEQVCYPKVDEQIDYVCKGDIFNYTKIPPIAYCWKTHTKNGTMELLNPGNREYTMIEEKSKTYWWNRTKILPHCKYLKEVKANVTSDSITSKYKCKYSSWGECKLYDGKLICDSKYDGNGDGVCQSGESCITIDFKDNKLTKSKTSFRELDFNSYDVECDKI